MNRTVVLFITPKENRGREGERGAVPSGLVDDEAVASMVSTVVV
jgi:hypothetical protein